MVQTSSGHRTGLKALRLVVIGLVALVVVALAFSFATNEVLANDRSVETAQDSTLVATIDGTGPGQIVAYGPNGTVRYRNESLTLYHDVDPSPVGDQTVTYVASDVTDGPQCPGAECLSNVVRRVNLSTGEGERIHSWLDVRNGSTQIHDVDRVNESVLLVADINYPDRVFMVDTTTDEVIWQWNVSESFGPDSGGDYPTDWTHVNDVEYLPDGRVMVSLRNQDQVVFVRPGDGLQENWTLGADGDHDVLYEQHNPDYVPAERGGPAILVADSENNRVVEYQRQNESEASNASRTSSDSSDGRWVQSWTWTDQRLQWPRDADRMPNGNTVIVDSHGSRILSVAPDGTVDWSRSFPDGGYDVEVLDTAAESDGPSAAHADLQSRTAPTDGLDPAYAVVSMLPPLVLHGLLYALPTWTTAFDAALIAIVGVAVPVWIVVEGGVHLRRRLADR